MHVCKLSRQLALADCPSGCRVGHLPGSDPNAYRMSDAFAIDAATDASLGNLLGTTLIFKKN